MIQKQCDYLAEYLAQVPPGVVVDHGLELVGQVLLVNDALVEEIEAA